MLGKIVRVRVTAPMNSVNKRFGYTYALNFGLIEGGSPTGNCVQFAYIMGVSHPVRHFEGRVVAIVRRLGGKGVVWVVAPKSTRFIVNDIKKALDFAENREKYNIDCLFERSCGAVVFYGSGEDRVFLLIKNKRSAHWGFPKGHIEDGETNEQTATREVLEETGLDVTIVPGFSSTSKYTIQGKVEKTVTIFLATASSRGVTLQEDEIDDSKWVGYNEALELLNFENDRHIFLQAGEFLCSVGAETQ